MNPYEYDILIPNKDKNDLYGEFLCVTNPEAYNFIEGRYYTPNGQGGMYWLFGEWRENIAGRNDAVYGYSMKGHHWDEETGESIDTEEKC